MREMCGKYAKKILGAAVCIMGGACVMFGAAPIALAVYLAACMSWGSPLLMYAGALAGVFMGTSDFAGNMYTDGYLLHGPEYGQTAVCAKYAALLGLHFVAVKGMDFRNKIRGGSRRPAAVTGTYAAVAAVSVFAADMCTYISSPIMAAAYGAGEAVLFLCCLSLLRPGMMIIAGEKHDADSNKVIISMMLLAAICLWSVPGDIYAGINISLMLGILLLLVTIYRTGAEYGFGTAVMVGAVFAAKQGQSEWLPMILLVSLVVMVGRALTGRRKGGTVLFYVLGIVLAVLASGNADEGISSKEAMACILNTALPAVLFAVIPAGRLRSAPADTGSVCMQAAAAEMNRMTAEKMVDIANTMRRLDYTFSGSEGETISLSRVGELMDGFSEQISRIGEAREVVDDRLLDSLAALGMRDVSVTETNENGGRRKLYVAGRTDGQGMVLSRQVARTLSEYYGKNIRVGMYSPSLFFDEYRTSVYEESAMYRGSYHVRRLKKCGSPVSGDNFSVREYDDGRLVMMLSDGMGSGSLASCESCLMLDTMEELLEAGFEPEYSISFANKCISGRNRGRTFTTFDMLVVDMYDGELRSYKQGASATYILHPGEQRNRIETISSTTLPIGVIDEAECDEADATLAAGDAVVMVSDGISAPDDGGHMEEVLRTVKLDDSKRLVDEIISRVMGAEDFVMRDDVTVMAMTLKEA